MSRKSDYTDDHILQRIHANGYERLEGAHINGASVHKLRHTCGMINYKTSKSLLSKKAGCIFIPCRPKGVLSLRYVKAEASRNGIDGVSLERDGQEPLDGLAISADDKLVWTRNGRTMTQSWNEVRKRALSVKRGVFFQADGTRRKARSGPLTEAVLADLAQPRHLRLPSTLPPVRKQKADYQHIPCAQFVALDFFDLEQWCEEDCRHCRPLAQVVLEKFQSFLSESDMDFGGTLHVKTGTSQVDRAQRLAIACRLCKSTNKARTYDDIRYRGFIYCDNPTCINTYKAEDRSGEACQYYIDLFRRHEVNSFSQAEQLFPKSKKYLWHHGVDVSTDGHKKKVYKYHLVAQALGFNRNLKVPELSDTELKEAFQAAIDKGAKTIGSLTAMLSPEITSFLNRKKVAGDLVHRRILAEMNFRFKRSYPVGSVDDAIDAVKATGCTSWSAVITRFPGLGERIIDLGYKEALLAAFGWTALVNYSGLSDTAILDKARELCSAAQLTNISALEREYSSLVQNIRGRSLIDRMCESLGFQKPRNWQEITYDELVAYVRDKGFTSPTLWSWECKGSYKHALSKDWVREVGRQLKWGQILGLDGYSYASLPETIVANILHLSDIEFIDHPPIESFSGYGGGKPFADFLLPDPLWIEVWAYGVDDTPPPGIFADYPVKRRHKEEAYAKHGMPLCSIEGGLLHRVCTIDGERHARGLRGFVRHVCRKLCAHGYPIECTAEFVDHIRASIGSESDSPMLAI